MKVPCCIECGSQDILIDAYAVWDKYMNAWCLHSVYEHTVCNSLICNGKETRLIWCQEENEKEVD
jgi:hypothetical protein